MGVGKKQIIEAIQEAERETSGEIRVHLSKSPDDDDILEAARRNFESLGMEQTRDRNGILLYFNTRLHKFAVYGDEGIHQKVGQGFWEQLSQDIRKEIRSTDLTHGITLAVHRIGQALKEYFPARHDDINELHNDITESE